MKNLLFAIPLVFFLTTACGDGVTRVVPEAASDTDDQSEKNDSEEISDSDNQENSVTDSEKPQKDDENAEPENDNDENADDDSDPEPDDGGDTASEDDGDSSQNDDDDSGDDENQDYENGMEVKEPVEQCPEGTNSQDEICQIDNCGPYMFKNTKSAAQGVKCGHIKDKPSTSKVCVADKNSCYKTEADAQSQTNPVPCCCNSELSEVGFGPYDLEVPVYYATETDDNHATASQELSCPDTVKCSEGFEYVEETDKCYKCSGQLVFDGEKYQCDPFLR